MQSTFTILSGANINILNSPIIISLSFTTEIIHVLGNTTFDVLYYIVSNKFSSYSLWDETRCR